MQQKLLNYEFVSLFPTKKPSGITNVDLRLENSAKFENQFVNNYLDYKYIIIKM